MEKTALEKMINELKGQIAEIRAQVADLRKEIHEYKMSGVGRKLDAEYKAARASGKPDPECIKQSLEELEAGEFDSDLEEVAYFVIRYQDLADYKREIEDRRKAIRIERENAWRKLRRLRQYAALLASL